MALVVRRSHGRVAFGEEVRIEVFLRHRDRDRPTPSARKRVQDDGRVEVALMVGGEHDRPRQARRRCSRPSTRRRKKTLASGRIHVRWLTFLTRRTNRPAIPRGKRERFGAHASLCRLLRQTAKVADGAGFAPRPFRST